MPTREALAGADSCELAARWGVEPETMRRLVASAEDMELETKRHAFIISGWRSQAEQAALGTAGRPAARDDLSTHRSCPATGVDVSLGYGVVVTEKHIWARILFMNGLQMGGRSLLDDDLLPIDWQHIDRGPRHGIQL